jgi:hypothetical protein
MCSQWSMFRILTRLLLEVRAQGRASVRTSAAGLLSRRTWFDPRWVHVKYLVAKVEVKHVFLRAPRFLPFQHNSAIPPYSASS